ncbi:unnamed protein product [Lampetra planeri]
MKTQHAGETNTKVRLLPASDLHPTRPGFAPTRSADATGDIAALTLGLNATWRPWRTKKIPHRGTGTTLSQSLAIHTSATRRSLSLRPGRAGLRVAFYSAAARTPRPSHRLRQRGTHPKRRHRI